MNVFGIGGWELVLVLIIMLVVAGPKRMAQWAYTLGRWTAKLRVMWEEVAEQLQAELQESGINVEIPKSPPTRQSIQRSLEDYGRQLAESAGNPQEEIKKIQEDIQSASKDVKKDLDEVDRTVKGAVSRNGVKQTAGAPGSAAPNSGTSTPAPKNNDDENPSEFGTWGG